MIRIATRDDAQEILEIYAPFIRDTSFTFETDVPDLPSFKDRISTYLQTHPWLVYEINGVIAGYAYGAKYRERVAYQWCTETSIYIHEQHRRSGVGMALYDALIKILSLQGFMNAYAVINLPNDRSVAFHEKCGYKWFANYEKVGYKLGRWKTVGWWGLQLNEYIDEPPAPLPFSQVHKSALEKIFEEAVRKYHRG